MKIHHILTILTTFILIFTLNINISLGIEDLYNKSVVSQTTRNNQYGTFALQVQEFTATSSYILSRVDLGTYYVTSPYEHYLCISTQRGSSTSQSYKFEDITCLDFATSTPAGNSSLQWNVYDNLNVSIASGTKYYLNIKQKGDTGGNYTGYSYATSDVYSGGNLWNCNSTICLNRTNEDLRFKLYKWNYQCEECETCTAQGDTEDYLANMNDGSRKSLPIPIIASSIGLIVSALLASKTYI